MAYKIEITDMNQLQFKKATEIEIADDSELYLIGFRIDSLLEDNCDFYTLYVDSERPIDSDGYPIIFFKDDDIKKVLETSNCGCEHLPLNLPDNFCFIDIAQTVLEIGTCEKTNNGNLLDSLNMIRDFIPMLHESRVHKKNWQLLCHAANHFTFSYDIKEFFDKNDVERKELIWAIEWALGATLLWSKYVR